MNVVITKIIEWCINHNVECLISTKTIDCDRFIHIKFTKYNNEVHRYYTFKTWNELPPTIQITIIYNMLDDLKKFEKE